MTQPFLFVQVAELLDIKKWKVQQYYQTAMKTLQSQAQMADLAHAM